MLLSLYLFHYVLIKVSYMYVHYINNYYLQNTPKHFILYNLYIYTHHLNQKLSYYKSLLEILNHNYIKNTKQLNFHYMLL